MTPRLFIGSSSESLTIAKGIKGNFEYDNIEVRIWSEDMFNPGEYTLDELIKFTKSFDFAIFVWAPDDIVQSRESIKNQPRDNVILEAGLFYGALGKDRVFLFSPKSKNIKVPSDLLGLNILRYNIPSDENFQAALSICSERVKKNIRRLGIINRYLNSESLENNLYKYKNLEAARKDIEQECLKATEIKIFANKGLEFFGSDSSIIALSDSKNFLNLKTLKLILLSPNSRWINRGLMALRKYETLKDFIQELTSTHTILELGMKKFTQDKILIRSGIKYNLGEPYFRFILTDSKVFVSTYAESPTTQVKDIPVYVYNNEFGSLYGALRRMFNDVWKNNSQPGIFLQELVEVTVSAGGIIYYKQTNNYYIALVEREDGSWVLPKGKKKTNEDIEQTAIREVSEEAGIQEEYINVIKKIDSYTYDETSEMLGIKKIIHFYLMTCLANDMPKLSNGPDHKSAKWWNIEESLPFMFYKYQQVLLFETLKKELNIEIKINPK